MPPQQLPLSRFPYVSTCDIDEARQIFRRFNSPIESRLIDRSTPFGWRGNAVKIGSMFMGANAYGGSSHSRTESVDNVFAMTFALSSVGGEGFDGRTQVLVREGHTAWLSSPSSSASFRYGTGYRGLNVTIPRAALDDALSVLGGRPYREVLRFDSQVSLSAGPGATLSRLVRFAADEVDHNHEAFSSPAVAARFVDSILFAMLLGQPNNHSATLRAEPAPLGPVYVQRAVDYLVANADQPIRTRDLVTVTGVCARSLQRGFLKHKGCSPTEFLRNRRLELARAKLITQSHDSVSEVARQCGFDHPGRFASEYRARFGESPSATRARTH